MSSMIPDLLPDQRARDLIRTELDRTLIVEAAAGTGKTTALVERIVAVLAAGRAHVGSLVAVTFTEKAAGELKLRLRAGLETARRGIRDSLAAGGQGPEREEEESRLRNLENALARLEEAWVGTIHAFCADLLRERSIEARVDPEFQTMTEVEGARLYRDAFDFWLQEKLQDPPEGVRRALRRVSRGSNDEDGPVGRLRKAGWALAEWRDFPAPWRRDPFDREEWIDALVDMLHELAELTETCRDKERDYFYTDTGRVRQLSMEIRTAEAVRPRDYDGLEAIFVDLDHWKFRKPRKGRGKMFGENVTRAEAHESHTRLAQSVVDFKKVADADLAALLQSELGEAVERYEDLKRKTGQLDFVDLLIRARDLLREEQAIREEFQERFTHIFVDEFQDTDPLQAEILLLLASGDPSTDTWQFIDPAPGKLFLVGDPKQSIYRFRRADVGIYHQVKDHLTRRGALLVHLTTSFRSVPAIQRAINRAFPALMDGDPKVFQAEYVPLEPRRLDHAEQPAVVALPVPAPYGGWGRVTGTAINASLPDAVAAWIAWLLKESGWKVTERERPEQPVPVEERHICILFRRFDSFGSDVTRGYVQALEARDVKHLLVGGRSFHDREEVEIIRTALMAIEWPDDELSVFATVRGALFSVGDEELLEYRHLYKRLHPFRLPSDGIPERLEPVRDSLAVLARLHKGRNDRPIAETITSLLETTRAHAGFALRLSGEQALANVLHVAEQARAYERSGGLSFRGFVQRLLEEANQRSASEAPILEDGSEGVRIMTVHKAKGLEFPVVILADPTASIAHRTAERRVDPNRRFCAMRLAGWSPAELHDHEAEEVLRDIAEGVRIAYVAATRARDLLVIPAVGGERYGDGYLASRRAAAARRASLESSEGASGSVGTDDAWPGDDDDSGDEGIPDFSEFGVLPTWVGPLNEGIYPAPADWARTASAAGCPAFGTDSVLVRPKDRVFDFDCVVPGAHRMSVSSGTSRADAGGAPGVGRSGRDASGSREARSGRSGGSSSSGGSEDGGSYDVVWWDPKVLSLSAERVYGIRKQDLMSKDVNPLLVDRDRTRYRDWRDITTAAVESAAVPTIEVMRATERAATPESAAMIADVPEVELVQLSQDETRPAGARFGALVHAVLAVVPFDADRDGVSETARLQGRVLGATEDEQTAAATAVAAALEHPLLRRAAEAWKQGACRRECPVIAREADGSVVDGVVDLAFREGVRWIVVDFKTDRDLRRELPIYRRQVAYYAAVISRATGQEAAPVLMQI